MAQRDEKEGELKVLLSQTPKSMWYRDLEEFMEQWEVRSRRLLMQCCTC